jgi:hypothetical protein
MKYWCNDAVTGCCVHGNETSGYVKDTFLNCLSDLVVASRSWLQNWLYPLYKKKVKLSLLTGLEGP